MTASSRSKRVLIYSHDSFGLGHVSRCRTIANALVEADHGPLGADHLGLADHRLLRVPPGIDFVRVPGVVKLRNGEYTSLNLQIDIEQTLEMRTSIIRTPPTSSIPTCSSSTRSRSACAARSRDTLRHAEGARHAAGARPARRHGRSGAAGAEWERKNVVPALRDLYDEIWIYGLPQINKPLAGIDLPPSVRHKMVYTGYLRRGLPRRRTSRRRRWRRSTEPFILVTAGGGGDGDATDRLGAARPTRATRACRYGAVIVFGPFMQPTARREVLGARRAASATSRRITFEPNSAR